MYDISPEFLDLLRQHVRADDLEGVDDALLRQYAAAALRMTEQQTARPLSEIAEMYGSAGKLPEDVVQAVLLLAGHWYNTREAVGAPGQAAAVPYGVSALLRPYRKLSRR